MADYSVDIKLAVAGARQLKAARRETTALSKEITTLNRLANKQSKTLPNSFNTLNKVLGQAKGNLNRVALGTTRYLRAINDVIDKEERLNRAYRKQKTDFKVIQRLRIKGLDINKQNIQAVRDELAAEIKLERAKRRTAKAEKEGAIKNKRRNRIIQSAGIGGGFPLLFGGGPLSAVAGGIGGGIGEALSPGGGFAGSIVATALVSQVQSFVDSTSKLGQAMSSLTPDTNALAQAMGIVGTQEEKRIQAIEKLNGKQAALTAAMDKMRETIGDEATNRLKAFGESTRLIGNEFAIAMTKMQAGLIPVINLIDRFFGISKGAKDSERARAIENSTNPEILRVQSEIAALENQTGGGRSGAKTRENKLKALKAELKVLGDQEVKTNKIAAKNETDRLTLEASLRATTDKTKLLQDTLQFGEQEAEIRQRILQFERDTGIVLDANGKQRIRDAMELERSLQRQVEFTQAIGASFRDSFRDAITGATSFGQAMSNVLNTIRDRLINMYLDQMFAQATMGRSGGGGIFGNLLGGLLGGIFGGGGGAVAPIVTDKVFDTAFDTSLIGAGSLAGKFANGGFAQKGKSYLVGERGPELFTPGATGGQISPMGRTNIVVNVDASGSNVEGDESQSQVLGQVLASAIQSELIKQKRPGGLLG